MWRERTTLIAALDAASLLCQNYGLLQIEPVAARCTYIWTIFSMILIDIIKSGNFIQKQGQESFSSTLLGGLATIAKSRNQGAANSSVSIIQMYRPQVRY